MPTARSGRGARLVGWGFAGTNFHVADASDQVAALRTRLTMVVDEPQAQAWGDFRSWYRRVFGHALLPFGFNKMTTSAWFLRYKGAQHKALTRAKDKLQAVGLRPSDTNTCNMFVKREVRNWAWSASDAEDPKPRVICSCPPVGKVAAGPAIVSITKELAHQWHNRNSIYFECGATQDEVADWFNSGLRDYGIKWILLTDFSKMDRGQSFYALKFVNDLLANSGLTGVALQFLRGQEKAQRIISRNGVQAFVPPFLKSGVPNTTLNNSVINALLQAYSFQACGAKPYIDYKIMVRGDDSVAFVRPGMEKLFPTIATKLGFKVKTKRVERVDQVRFCSNAFYPTTTGDYVPAPTMKCLAKLCATISSHGRKHNFAHMRGVVLGLLALTNHVPLLNDYVQRILQITTGARGAALIEAQRAARLKYFVGTQHTASIDADTFMCHMYGVTQAHVDAVRTAISRMEEPGIYGGAIVADFFAKALAVEHG